MIALFLLLVTVNIDAYPIGQTTNKDGTLTYWIVEFSGFDCYGNLHTMREEVDLRGETDKLDAIPIGTNRFMEKFKQSDRHVTGFLEALEKDECESLKVLP